MRHSTKILLSGLGLSALVLAAGYTNTLCLERDLSEARAQCQQASSNTPAHGPWERYAAHGADAVPARMPGGTVVPLPNQLDEAAGKNLRAALDEQEEVEFRLRAEREAAATSPTGTAVEHAAASRTPGVNKSATGHFVPDPPAKWALECDPNKLVSISDLPPLPPGLKLDQPQHAGSINLDDTGNLIDIQAKIVDVDRAVRNSKSSPAPVALALFGLSAMPWLWYALLRRIAELRAAVGGNPPEA